MARLALTQKLQGMKSNRKALFGLVGSFVVMGSTGLGLWLSTGGGHVTEAKGHGEHAGHDGQSGHGHAGHGAAPGLQERVVAAIESAQAKMDRIQEADEENRRLRLENANLRLRLETVQLDCRSRDAVAHARDTQAQLSDEAWSAVARTKASIRYEIPANLLSPQLYTLAVTYLRASENEKAAVLLTHLTGLSENPAFKTPKNYLLTGVAWYRLDNLKLADTYFDLAMKDGSAAEGSREEDQTYHAQARLWKAVIAQRAGKSMKAQFWLRDLLDHHPHSTEAAWVNPGKETKGERGIASENHH